VGASDKVVLTTWFAEHAAPEIIGYNVDDLDPTNITTARDC
jgi:hypothetical protein